MSKKTFDYYNFDKAMSYDAVYSFIMGARGLGKTYGAKKRVISNAIKKNEQFIYLRRYKTELKGRLSFFADIAHEFPEQKFRVNGFLAQMQSVDKDEKKDPWKTIGLFAALSTSQSYKSQPFPNVTSIIFDEFIIEKGAYHYLPDEANMFNDFYSTVDRYQDKTRAYFLANAISIMNPYFLEYDIKADGKEWVSKADGFIVCHFANSELFKNQVGSTRFGTFIRNETESYADYAIGSEFKDNNNLLIGKKTGSAYYYMTVETKSGTFSVWIDLPYYFVQEKRPKQEILYTTVPEKLDKGKKLLMYSDKQMQYLRAAFKNGNVHFDTPVSKNAFIQIFKR